MVPSFGKWWNFIKEENMDTIVYDAVQDVKAVAEYNGGHRNPSEW